MRWNESFDAFLQVTLDTLVQLRVANYEKDGSVEFSETLSKAVCKSSEDSRKMT